VTGPSKPTMDDPFRVIHGGSWAVSSASVVRAAYIGGGTPTVPSKYVGFRCAQRGARQPMGKVTP
jgi:formylglycine-generating enzyme required for sulfatase activity